MEVVIFFSKIESGGTKNIRLSFLLHLVQYEGMTALNRSTPLFVSSHGRDHVCMCLQYVCKVVSIG